MILIRSKFIHNRLLIMSNSAFFSMLDHWLKLEIPRWK